MIDSGPAEAKRNTKQKWSLAKKRWFVASIAATVIFSGFGIKFAAGFLLVVVSLGMACDSGAFCQSVFNAVPYLWLLGFLMIFCFYQFSKTK